MLADPLRQRVLDLLRAIAWVEVERGATICPSCTNYREFDRDHRPDCELAAVILELQKGGR